MKAAKGIGPKDRMRSRRRSAGVGMAARSYRIGNRRAADRPPRGAFFKPASEGIDPALVLSAVAGEDLQGGAGLADPVHDVQAHVAEQADLPRFGDRPLLVRAAGAGGQADG